ncbi:threonine-phosphate decarboxylase CobD [Methylocella sp.]|uniref:threonine-phosphate decarboxylase CobD n=1 Tax=Methylocella sp. TaxID=1978226 RepID=UPI0035B123A8
MLEPQTGAGRADEPAAHGGDLALARRAFPAASQPWLDLSTGVNPYAYPFRAPPAEALTRLPEPQALAELEAAARAAFGAPASVAVVAGAGTQALISWLPRLLRARRAAVLGFSYAEHALAFARAGAEVETAARIDELEDFDAAVVVNPNNPDGRMVDPQRLAALAARLARKGATLIVDEAFADFGGRDASLAPLMPPAGAVVLRSFGKAYGLPGLRLGFALCGAELAARLRAALGPWPVAGPALDIARQAYGDADWLAATGRRLAGAAAALDALLAEAGLAAAGRAPLFRLVEARNAEEIFERLARAGIWTRRFAQKPRWLRLAIPEGEEERVRLREALRTGPL